MKDLSLYIDTEYMQFYENRRKVVEMPMKYREKVEQIYAETVPDEIDKYGNSMIEIKLRQIEDEAENDPDIIELFED